MHIEKNKVVSINYILKDAGGEILDQSPAGEPLEYLHGSGSLIPGLEKNLEGRRAGDSFSAAVEPADAYGLYDESLILKMKKEKFDTEEELSGGMEFGGQTDDGEYRVFRVMSVRGDTVTVDGNHPLAGQKLFFDIAVHAVREATPEEIAHGHLHSEESCCGGDCAAGACACPGKDRGCGLEK
jgi:FKBP-type peptidyl-prolyl cis-trans isomerase SlyD